MFLAREDFPKSLLSVHIHDLNFGGNILPYMRSRNSLFQVCQDYFSANEGQNKYFLDLLSLFCNHKFIFYMSISNTYYL